MATIATVGIATVLLNIIELFFCLFWRLQISCGFTNFIVLLNFNYKICCFINTSSSWKKNLLVIIFYSFYGCQWSTRLTALFSSLHNFKYGLFNAVKYAFAFPLKKNTKKSCTYVNRLGIKKINAKMILQS